MSQNEITTEATVKMPVTSQPIYHKRCRSSLQKPWVMSTYVVCWSPKVNKAR